MIAILQGFILEKNEGEVILSLESGIAFQVQCSMTTLSALPAKNEKATLYTHLHVREDLMELYGFIAKEERELFKRLISVSGIGPRTALFMLGSMPTSELRLAILTGDVQALSRAPGIGKKIAQRISLELKDKLTKEALQSGVAVADMPIQQDTSSDAISEAIQALQSLGYSPQEATKALKGISTDNATADGLIKQALRNMAQNG